MTDEKTSSEIERGDVWLVALPRVAGREQGGTRPGIVVQDATYGAASPLVLAVSLTSQLAALRFPATVEIQPSALNGLTVPSVALGFQRRAVDRARFVRRLGALDDADMEAVEAELRGLTSL